jgi:DNA-directed RNA polymerase subunit RPC12/RpoP
MSHLETERLERDSWLDASDEDHISILCPGCGASIDLRLDERSIACPACGIVLLSPKCKILPQNGPERPTKAPLRLSTVSLIGSRQ